MKSKILSYSICLITLFSLMSCQKKSVSHESHSAGPDTAQSSAPNLETLDEIRVGAVLSLTGSTASFGQSTREGIQLAMDEINAQGGFNGKKFKLIALDDQSKPDEAATVMTRLVTQDNVLAVLGEVSSSISLAMAPIAQSARVPMISPSSTNPKVTQIGNYIFRVCFIDPFQGTVMAKFARQSQNYKKVAILRDIKNDYSVGLADYFTQTFTQLGGEVITDQSYSEGDVDFTSQLTNIKAQNPEAIFVPGYYTEVGLIARQARALGITVPLMGGDGWDSSKLFEIGGTAIEGSYFSNHYSPDDPSPKSQAFTQNYKAKYGKTADGMAVMGYDAMIVLHDALKRAGKIDRDAVRTAIENTKNFEGASGVMSLNALRDAVKSAVVLQVKNGGYAFSQKVQPE